MVELVNMSEKYLFSSVGRHVAVAFFGSLLVAFTFLTMVGASEDGKILPNTQQGPVLSATNTEFASDLLSAANTKFALDLYKRHVSPADQNIFMSPLSITVALAMTYLGARGETKAQMRQVLHFTDVEENLHQAFTHILSALNSPDQAYKLYMANRLFGEKSYSFREEFLAAGRKHYGAELEPVDFV